MHKKLDVVGGSRHPAYNRWLGMHSRCYNVNHVRYDRYGGSGVTVCEEWHLFSNYMKWFDENYIEGYDMDKDLSGEKIYSPSSCKFISRKDNNIEAVRRRDNSYNKGKRNYMAKSKGYYSEFCTTRVAFKKICSTQDWNFDDFEEIYSGIKTRNNTKKYFYKIKNSSEEQ